MFFYLHQMRIAIDARMSGRGFTGIGRYTTELLNHLARIDSKNEYLVLLRKDNFAECQIKQPNFKKVLADFPHYSLSEQTKFLKFLNKLNLDLVHFPHFNAPIFYRKPFIVTIHDLIHTLYPGKKKSRILHRLFYGLVIRSAVKHARYVIAVSDNTKRDLEKILHTDSAKIGITYEAVDPQYHEILDHQKIVSLKAKYHIVKPFLLYIGNWRYHKNVHGLVAAFNLIKDRYKVDCQLVITGKMGKPEQAEAEAAIKNSPYRRDIILPGFAPEEELPLFYNAATIFTFPSFYEGFGLPPLEAMACGTPVVSSKVSSMPEVLGDAAIYFDPRDTDKMAEQIVKVFQDTNLQKQMKIKGLEQVRRYSWQRMAKETLAIYQKINS